MSGQPRSANSRRDAAISSATAMRSTYSVCRIGVERKKPVLPDLYNSVSRSDKADNQRAAEMVDCSRQWHVRHDRDVGGLIAAIGEIDAGRGLRGAAHPQENDIGMLQIFRRLTVVADHAEVERIDPLEIVGVEHVLRAGSRRRVLPEVGFEQRQYWARGQTSTASRTPRSPASSRLERSESTSVKRTIPGAFSISAITRSSCAGVRTSG